MRAKRSLSPYKKATYFLLQKHFDFSLISDFFSYYKYFFVLLLLYLILRLFYVTSLPIFNDEAIYLHWGWMEMHNGNNYLSLYDGKQPLLLWLFGYEQQFFSDPLYAGRLISIIAGSLTMTGIYVLGSHFFSKKVAILSALLYIVLNVFVFYDRQALMESTLCTVGVLSCYYFFLLLQKPTISSSVRLGIWLGVGLFIKSTAVVFVAAVLILGGIIAFSNKDTKYRNKVILLLTSSLLIMFAILTPLLMQKNVSNIIVMNARYAYSIMEFLRNPFGIVWHNTVAAFFLLYAYLTPGVFVVSAFGMWLLWKSKDLFGRLLIAWFFITMVVFIFFTKDPSVRYIVAFLPATVFFCAYAIEFYGRKSPKKYFEQLLSVCVMIYPCILTILLLVWPVWYFTVLNFMTPYANMEYVSGWTSGYGIPQTVSFLTKVAANQNINVYVRSDSGNPEDAMYVYLGDKYVHNINVLTIVNKSQLCLQAKINKTTTYFVTRNTLDVAPCMKNIEKFPKPFGNDYVDIFQVTSS